MRRADPTFAAARSDAGAATPDDAHVRERLARDLHDSFPQEFQVILLQLDLALSTCDDAHGRRHIEAAMRAARAGLATTRTHIERLRGQAGGARPCPRAERWRAWNDLVGHAARAALAEHAVTLDFTAGAAPHLLAPELGREVEAIVAEAARNSARHAGVARLGCATASSRDTLDLVVRDAGAGWDALAQAGRGYGIRGMRERARGIGATLELFGRPGAGTLVRLSLPLPHAGIVMLERGRREHAAAAAPGV